MKNVKLKKECIISINQDLIDELQAAIDSQKAMKDAGPYEVLECFTADFGDGIKADIKVVNADNGPFIDPVLFHNGREVFVGEVEYQIVQEFCFEYNKTEYVVKIKPKTLSDTVSKNHCTDRLEDYFTEDGLIIDKGYYLEIYINPDGVDSGTSNGRSYFFYVNKPVSVREFLSMDKLKDGNLKDGTMTINLIPAEGDAFEKERMVSERLIPLRTFRIPVTFEMYGTLDIEAASLEEAIEIAEDDESPLPDEKYYVDASFKPSLLEI